METTRLYKHNKAGMQYWEISVTDAAELKISHAKRLQGAPTTRLVPVAGKNIGRANETTPHQQAELEMQSRIRKQLDKGYVTTIEEAATPAVNTLGFELPVLAVVYGKVKTESIDWDSSYIQRKFNGHRCMSKQGQLYSRGGKVINLPHVVQAIADLGMSNLHLDGELYLHGKPLQEIGSLVTKLRDESATLEYHVYDVVDTEKSFSERFIQCENLSGNAVIKIVSTQKVTTPEQVTQLTAEFVREGYEGSILRHGPQGYQTGKRSSSILKVKDYKDSEAKIIGMNPGTPYVTEDGRVLDNPVWVAENPFNPGTTFEMSQIGTLEHQHIQFHAAESFFGKIMTFKYFELSNDKIPQQPVGLAWKEDL